MSVFRCCDEYHCRPFISSPKAKGVRRLSRQNGLASRDTMLRTLAWVSYGVTISSPITGPSHLQIATKVTETPVLGKEEATRFRFVWRIRRLFTLATHSLYVASKGCEQFDSVIATCARLFHECRLAENCPSTIGLLIVFSRKRTRQRHPLTKEAVLVKRLILSSPVSKKCNRRSSRKGYMMNAIWLTLRRTVICVHAHVGL